MNNNIQEDYCSFEVTKLLKEKGFGVPVHWCFTNLNKIMFSEFPLNRNAQEGWLSRPTHSLAIKWIRENFGIHIFSDFSVGWEGFIIPVGYSGDGVWPIDRLDGFKSAEKATDVALLYTLKKLI